jgi:hypothetical protein
METHWSDARFMALVGEHGYPGSAPKNVVSELDRWMPTDTRPRSARRSTWSPASAWASSTACSGAGFKRHARSWGAVFAVIDTFRQGAEAVGKYQEVGDWGGGALAVLRAICDGGAAIADNVSNVPPGFIESACFRHRRSSSASAPSPPRWPAIGVAVGAIAAAVASIAGAAKTVKVVARLISAALNGIKVVLDYALLLDQRVEGRGGRGGRRLRARGQVPPAHAGQRGRPVTDTIATIGGLDRRASSACSAWVGERWDAHDHEGRAPGTAGSSETCWATATPVAGWAYSSAATSTGRGQVVQARRRA